MEQNESLKEINTVAHELMQLLLPLSEEQMNKVPFEGSWTATQLATHVTKSNFGIAQALQMEGQTAERKPDQRVKELKDTFLNFSIKMKSPPFIVPEDHPFKKESVLLSLKNSNDHLKDNSVTANPAEMINLPAAFGEITKLELVHFVLYHTQRHLHQLKNIVRNI